MLINVATTPIADACALCVAYARSTELVAQVTHTAPRPPLPHAAPGNRDAQAASAKMSGPGTDVAGEMQDYLMQKGVNTLFVELVEHLLAEKPANPIQFIVEYLSAHYPDMTRAVPVTGFDPDSGSEPDDGDVDEAKDDERDELRTFTLRARQRRRAVSAPVTPDDPASMAPVVRGPHKSPEVAAQLGEILRGCALYGALTTAEIALLVDAARPAEYAAGDVVFHQGDDADRIFVLEDGQVKVVQQKERGVDRVRASLAPPAPPHAPQPRG